MSNVLAFPKSPELLKSEELYSLVEKMRANLASACGSLSTYDGGLPEQKDICDVLDRITDVAILTDEYVAILRAFE